MRSIPSSKAEKNFADLLEAGQRGPIVIREQNTEVAVIISPEEYERLHQLKVDRFNATCDRAADEAKARGLTEEILSDLLADGEN